MKEHPILFSTDMVKAILDGKKTQTRRVIKPQPVFKSEYELEANEAFFNSGGLVKLRDKYNSRGELKTIPFLCPYGQVGDRLWVRESFGEPFGGPFGKGYTRW